MAYRSRTKIGVDVLKFSESLDAKEMVKIKNRLTRLINKNRKKLVLDLKETRCVELAGVGILIDRLMKIRAAKGDIKVFNMRPEVARALEIIGVNRLIESYHTEEEAIRSFAA